MSLSARRKVLDTLATPADEGEMNPAEVLKRAQAFFDAGDISSAESLARQVVAKLPGHVEGLVLTAGILRERGRLGESIRLFKAVLKERPSHVGAHAGLAAALFHAESWLEAWERFDIRFCLMDEPPRVTRSGPDGAAIELPMWRGGPAPERILVMAEQGIGDTLQFARFLPRLAGLGTEIHFVVEPRLNALMRTLGCPLNLLERGVPGQVAKISHWVPLMGLPRALGLGVEDYAARTPYLSADPERVQRWRQHIGHEGFRVGIAWQGNPDPRIDKGRSMPLEALRPLADIPGVRLISLQKGDGTEQIERVSFKGRIETLGPQFDAGPDAFADTAAVMESLDLVVSVDTAVAHMAGALAIPTILLLKAHGADWRWLARAESNVWYPETKLVRQRSMGEWDETVQRVGHEVTERMKKVSPVPKGMVMTPVSAGELIDKLAILAIKCERMNDEAKLANVRREREALETVRDYHGLTGEGVDALAASLKAINEELWVIEDEIRDCERAGDFGPRFIELARAVYRTNDRRADVKREINRVTGSLLVEEKSYAAY